MSKAETSASPRAQTKVLPFAVALTALAVSLALALRPVMVPGYTGPDGVAYRIHCPPKIFSVIETQVGGDRYLCHLEAPWQLLPSALLALVGVGSLALWTFLRGRITATT